MDVSRINNTASAGIDLTIKSAETVNQINQMVVDKNQEVDNKMIRVNVEQKLDDLKKEGIAQNIDILA
jgi:transcription initiation factor IIF auxiliary subunit